MNRGDSGYASLLAESIINHGGDRYFPPDSGDPFDSVEEAIKVLRQSTRRMLRYDRRRWFHEACAAIPSARETNRASPTISTMLLSDYAATNELALAVALGELTELSLSART
eukprot:4209486-Amphidinium_carterae.1